MQTTVDLVEPRVPPAYLDQRYFTPTAGEFIVPKRGDDDVRVMVYRHANDDSAELSLKLTNGYISAHLSAPEMRRIATALFSAAHDLDRHPAAQLQLEQAA